MRLENGRLAATEVGARDGRFHDYETATLRTSSSAVPAIQSETQSSSFFLELPLEWQCRIMIDKYDLESGLFEPELLPFNCLACQAILCNKCLAG